MKEPRAPSPAELKNQLLGAAVALGWVCRMMEHHPELWAADGQEICKQLYNRLLDARPKNVHARSLWDILQVMQPEGKEPEWKVVWT